MSVIKKVFEEMEKEFGIQYGTHIQVKPSEIKFFLATSLIRVLEELPTGHFDSTPYKQELINELKQQ